MNKIFYLLKKNKIKSKQWFQRRGNYIFISIPNHACIMLPVGESVSLDYSGATPANVIEIGIGGIRSKISFTSSEEREAFIAQFKKALVPSTLSRAIKWTSLGLAAGFIYMVWGGYQQAQSMMNGKTAWQQDPAAIEKSLPSLNETSQPQGGIDAILANRIAPQDEKPVIADNLDSLLSQTGPVLPPQGPMAKQLFDQAMSVGRQEYMNAIPPSSSSAGLDAFGLSTAGAGCDPALAFDK
ncbi:hypothetical protein AADX40_15145 [Aeromonas veronii]|uniref:hypothetical protein n=1 Tax=Aeromonas veronii TaxID=654 RepID=UPI0031594F90